MQPGFFIQLFFPTLHLTASVVQQALQALS
jgi:hypothetical protein